MLRQFNTFALFGVSFARHMCVLDWPISSYVGRLLSIHDLGYGFYRVFCLLVIKFTHSNKPTHYSSQQNASDVQPWSGDVLSGGNALLWSLATGNETAHSAAGTGIDHIDHDLPDYGLFYRHSLTLTAVYCVAYIFVFIVGLVGNSFVIAVVLRSPRMRTVTNFFIVNLAVADILVIVFCLPATLMGNLFVRKYISRKKRRAIVSAQC